MNASRPSARDLLTAMGGIWDPTDPHVQVLRSAWLLAWMPDWYAPSTIIKLRSGESGEGALVSLGLDIEQLARDALIDRIAAELGDDKDCALAVAQLAAAYTVVAQARNSDDQPKSELDALGDARSDYEAKFEQARIA